MATLNNTELAGNSTLVSAPLAVIVSEVDPETCRLLGPVALGVQGLMGVLVLGSLVLKRAQEKPRRKWRVWAGDVSKQIVGQAFVHASNVLISDQLARHKTENPCSLYALNILVDTTLGVLVLFGFLKVSTRIIEKSDPTYRSGDYGNPFNMSTWTKQAAVYVACLTAMKIMVIVILWVFPSLVRFASYLLSFIRDFDAQVVISMLIIPLVMNVFQFLVVDSMIKSKSEYTKDDGDEESRRGFLDSDDLFDRDDEENGSDSGHEDGGERRRSRVAAKDASSATGELDSGYANSLPSSHKATESTSGGTSVGTTSGQATPAATSTPLLSSQSARHHAYPPVSVAPTNGGVRSSLLGPVTRLPSASSSPSPPPAALAARTASPGPPVFEKTSTTAFESEKVSLPAAADDDDDDAGTDDGWGVNDWDADTNSLNSLDLAREVDEMTNEKRPVPTVEGGDEWRIPAAEII